VSATIPIGVWELAAAAGLVVLLAAWSRIAGLGVHGRLLLAAGRTAAQLSLIGLILLPLFRLRAWYLIVPVVAVMLAVAGYEVRARMTRRFRGAVGYFLPVATMALACVATTLFALLVLLRVEDPWYHPRYSIPLLGMLLGNAMTGIALALDDLTDQAAKRRAEIEARLALGMTAAAALAPLVRASMRRGLVPVINAMAAAGIVSLPGMMTGHLLGGAEVWTAVSYQILIMYLIAASTGIGVALGVRGAGGRLFDHRERLVLERLAPPE